MGSAIRERRSNSFRVASSVNPHSLSQGCQSATLGWNWRTHSALVFSESASRSNLYQTQNSLFQLFDYVLDPYT